MKIKNTNFFQFLKFLKFFLKGLMDIKNDMNTKDKYSSSFKKLSFEENQFNMENEEFIQVNLKLFFFFSFVFKFQSNILEYFSIFSVNMKFLNIISKGKSYCSRKFCFCIFMYIEKFSWKICCKDILYP